MPFQTLIAAVERQLGRVPAPVARALPWLLLAVVTCVVAAPWLGTSLVPSMDYPAHLALVEVMHHLGEPGHVLDASFEWGAFPAPNAVFAYLAALLSLVAPVDVAGHLAFVLLPVGLLWAFAFFLTTFGRSAWLATAVVPFLVQWPLTEGFLDYYAGVASLLVALAALHRYLRAPGRRRGWVAGGLAVLVFVAHVQAFFLFGLGVGLLAALHAVEVGRDRRGLLRLLARVAAVTLPALVVAAVWYFGQQGDLDHALTQVETQYPSAESRFLEILHRSVFVLHPAHGELLGIALLGVFGAHLVLVVGRMRAQDRDVVEVAGPADGDGARAHGRIDALFPRLLLLAALLVYFFAPLNVGWYWNFHSRTLLLVWPLAIVALLPAWRPTPALWGALAAVPLLFGVNAAVVTWSKSLRSWDAYTEGFLETLAAAPERSRLLYVPESTSPTGFRSGVWRHLGQYHTVLNEGMTTFSFGWHPGRIVRERVERPIIEYAQIGQLKRLGRSPEWCVDVVLQVGPTQLETHDPGRFGLRARHGAWSLYDVKAPCLAEGP